MTRPWEARFGGAAGSTRLSTSAGLVVHSNAGGAGTSAACSAVVNAAVSGLGPAPGGEMPNQSCGLAGFRSGVVHVYSITPAIPQSLCASVETVSEM